jgi:hypothetical protein
MMPSSVTLKSSWSSISPENSRLGTPDSPSSCFFSL